jgi:hypothetical protein
METCAKNERFYFLWRELDSGGCGCWMCVLRQLSPVEEDFKTIFNFAQYSHSLCEL